MRNYRKRAYYDPMSDSVTPMSQSELASEAEAVFDIVFDEDPNALLQSGAYGKIFDHFKRYGISNDYSDAVSMANYIEKNLLKHSHRTNRKGSINEALLRELMDEIVERERETGGWGAGDFNSDIEEVLFRRMTSPHSTKRLQDDLGVPIDENWRYDADGMTDLRFISVREFLHDQRWDDIFDVEYGSQRNASRRANHKTANRPNEQQKKDFINPARELTSVDYGESHDGSYYMSFGLGSVPNAIMVRIGDNELERVLEGLGHYYSFSADGYSFYLSYDNWEIWDHNGNGGFTISDGLMTVVHDGLFEIFLRGGMPHTSSRRRAYKDDMDLLLGFLDGDMDSDTFGQLSSPGQNLDRLLLDILDSYEARNVKDLIDWYHGLASPVERDLSELSSQGAIDLSTIEGRMAELIEHNLSHQI